MPSCWICGDHIEIMSKEHLVKASDLKQAFPRPITQKDPLYLHHKEGRSNVPIASIPKNKQLKSSAPMCCKCNNERTQIHDQSWTMLHKYLISESISQQKSNWRMCLAKVVALSKEYSCFLRKI